MNEQPVRPAIITRFAPSPTGLLHLGHGYSALLAQNLAKQAGGRFLLRIEDIDPLRCQPEFEAAIFEDLDWLGLEWEQPVRRQSDHMDTYEKALERLGEMALLYPCFCSRKDIRDEIAAAGGAPHQGPEGPHYPGICRALAKEDASARKEAGEPFALRLDTHKALSMIKEPLLWYDADGREFTARPEQFGDVVLARKDIPTSYHLAVTLDDDLQGVTLVSRGEDLLPSTDVHRLLQELLDLSVPTYHHHPLLNDKDGRRLAKRHKSETIRALREAGNSPEEVRAMAWL
ncbi:MAG: tRNA glutamyl-Q(34) synthetase GluQRS [Rhodospirillaceae bacterium]|nr:tRNA glutamyl-Q(34) synthetase GluQRS [Rhodospirillaceae bacterium]MBL6930685.1 tRNA glutamyl-Q(34) synthetase GluQRS [Rhodospirillales bacterium]MBL6941297.1 tRNA glutamyl-Q(34) synthetase GluQRS [Rhodospirillales bacterium]